MPESLADSLALGNHSDSDSDTVAQPGTSKNKAEATPWKKGKKPHDPTKNFQQEVESGSGRDSYDNDDHPYMSEEEEEKKRAPGAKSSKTKTAKNVDNPFAAVVNRDEEELEEDDSESDKVVQPAKKRQKVSSTKAAAKKNNNKTKNPYVDDEAEGASEILTSSEEEEEEDGDSMIADSSEEPSEHSDASLERGNTEKFSMYIKGQEKECEETFREAREVRERLLARKKDENVSAEEEEDDTSGESEEGDSKGIAATRGRRERKPPPFFRPPSSFSDSTKRAQKRKSKNKHKASKHVQEEEDPSMERGDDSVHQKKEPIKKVKVPPLALTLLSNSEKDVYIKDCIHKSYFGQPEIVEQIVQFIKNITDTDRYKWNLDRVNTVPSMLFDGVSGSGKSTLMKIIAELCTYSSDCINYVSGTMLDSFETITSVVSGAPMGYKGCKDGTALAHRFRNAQEKYPKDALLFLVIDEVEKAGEGVLNGLLEALTATFYTQDNEVVHLGNLVVLLAGNTGEGEIMRQTLAYLNPKSTKEERAGAIRPDRVKALTARHFRVTQSPAIVRRITETHVLCYPLSYSGGLKVIENAISKWTYQGALGEIAVHASVKRYFARRANPHTGIQMIVNALCDFLKRVTRTVGPEIVMRKGSLLGVNLDGSVIVKYVTKKGEADKTSLGPLPTEASEIVYDKTGLFTKEWLSAHGDDDKKDLATRRRHLRELAQVPQEEEEEEGEPSLSIQKVTHTNRKRRRDGE